MVQRQPDRQFKGMEAPNGPNDSQPDHREKLQQRRELVTQLGDLSSLIEQSVQDLSQPMTVILGLSELLLPQIESGSHLAADLVTVTKQIKRMSRTVNEVNELVGQRNKLLKILATPQSTSTRLKDRAASDHLVREE